jgi:hypothetical protein
VAVALPVAVAIESKLRSMLARRFDSFSLCVQQVDGTDRKDLLELELMIPAYCPVYTIQFVSDVASVTRVIRDLSMKMECFQ